MRVSPPVSAVALLVDGVLCCEHRAQALSFCHSFIGREPLIWKTVFSLSHPVKSPKEIGAGCGCFSRRDDLATRLGCMDSSLKLLGFFHLGYLWPINCLR